MTQSAPPPSILPLARWTLVPAPDGGWQLWHPTHPALTLYLYPNNNVGCTLPVCRVMGWQEWPGVETGEAWERRRARAAQECQEIRDAFDEAAARAGL